MTKLADIRDENKESQLIKVGKFIFQYEEYLGKVEEEIKIKGKLLEHANRENPSLQYFYDQKRAEVSSVLKLMEAIVQRTRGRLYKQYTEHYNRELGDRAIEKYIDQEKEYLDYYELYLAVKELYDKYDSVVDAFRSRGYSLNNITKIRVAALEDQMI